MGEPSIDSLHDQYEDQLSAARFKAERDAARQEADKSLMDAITWEMEAEGMADELVHIEVENKRLGRLVWRLQNRLAKAHRHERNLRKGMRMWREKAIGGPVRTVSAYDLLPQEERDALAWVRENGGLESVKGRRDGVVGHCSTKQQLDFDFWLSGRVMYALGFDEDMADRDEVERRLLDRLMPEGYEWPRFEDGESVRIGDKATRYEEDFEVRHIATYSDGSFLLNFWSYASGERVKRPAVIAADGEPLEVGQTVYVIANGKTHHVTEVDAVYKRFRSMEQIDGSHWLDPMCFTHERPVLDADGVRIKVGDTVYEVGKNYPHLIVGRLPEPGAYRSVRVVYPSGASTYLDPERLTHTKPEQDSWDSVWMDVSNGGETPQGMKRRCKAIAERGE